MSENERETREELIRYLEQLSGRTLKTREDIRAYLNEVSVRKAADDPSVRWWKKAKHLTLCVVLAFAFAQYYLLDVFLQIMSLREVTYFVPATARVLKSLLRTVQALA